MKSSLLILAVVIVSLATAQRRPPNYSQEYMPETSFDCRDKILGGYYADIETDCQMFHVCVKVPGVGVQDFRFLCPNDTSFDQENQICASWYEVDCEANVLFYSDNFDLYRIGHSPSSAALPSSSSANPIPLGPSTARPLAARSRPRPQQSRLQPQQSRPQEDEEEFYLQRSDTGDRRLQQQGKDLRSSSSSYYGRNKGKVEEEYGGADAYLKKTAKPYKPAAIPTTAAAPTTTYVTDNPTTLAKKKVAVRKLRKRPQQQQQQLEDATTAATPFDQQGSTYRGQQGFNSARNYDYSAVVASSTTTRAPVDNYSAYTPRYNTIQRGGSAQPTTQSPSSYPAYDATYQQPAAQNDYGANSYSVAQRSSSPRPAQLPTTFAPANNYQTVQRKATDYSVTTLQTSAPSNYYQGSYQSTPNYQPSEYTSGNNYNYDYYTQTSSPAPSYDQYNYQTVARGTGRQTPSSTVTTPAYDAYQTTSEAYKYKNDNYNYQRTVQAQFNAQPAYQQDSGADQESLRTAQSSNYGPSSFNNYQNSYDNKVSKPAANNYNNTDKYYTSGTTAKSSPAFTQRSAVANTYTSSKPAPSYEYSPQPSTAAPPRPFSAAASQAPAASSRLSTAASSTIRRQQSVSSTTQVPSTAKSPKDVSYDYAYYDEGNTEYDGLDPISDHHFGKGKESFKVSRSAKN